MVEKQLPSTVYNHFQNVKLFKEQEIGHGSYATVYRAQCDDLSCAAKVLHGDFFDQQDPDPGEPKFILRFVEECKILPSITHPNIVQCFGTYQDPDTDLPVLLMELMDENLTNYLERFTDPLPYHIEISFSYDIALGLSYLHSRGYIHRDLSSNNVLIMAGIRAKITDFGMCRAISGISRQTRLTVCPGTPPFMPPEAVLEPPMYTYKLDIFTLGVLMIQIMSRQYPDPGRQHEQILPSMLLKIIPEEERRSNHIKLIRCDHPMLPLAKQYIQNRQEMRPSSRDVCNDLRLLIESHDYQQSKDEASVEHKLKRESQLHQLEIAKIMMEMQDKIEIMNREYSQQIEAIHCYYGQHERELQLQLTKTTTDMQDEIETMKVKHSQEIESIRHYYVQHERELQLQLTKTTMDTQDKFPGAGSPVAKGTLIPIPFDPSDLPDPVFNTHDLEMFHQQACSTEDPYASSNMSLLIDPRSNDLGDYSGPNLDDHLAYRSHDSGHMGLSDPELDLPPIYSQNKPTIPQQMARSCNNESGTVQIANRKANDVHFEVYTSLESKPSMSDKPDPYPSTPREKAHSAYSGEKRLNFVFEESSVDHGWVNVVLTVDKKDGKDGLSSLDSQPRHRERAPAFSIKPDKTVSDKSQKAKPSIAARSTPREKAYIHVDIDTPILCTDDQSATPCWYCTNLTTLKICDVCGNNMQHRKATI